MNFMDKLNAASVPLDCDYINYVEDWLFQHIKNTDFGYKGKMLHSVPEPYNWDESFMVFYKRLDDEHKGLFDCIRECGEDPSNQEKYDNCKSLLRRHFDYEESEFCKVATYDCHGHYLKHSDSKLNSSLQAFPLMLLPFLWPRTGLPSTSRTLTMPTEESFILEDTTLFQIHMFGITLSLLTSSRWMMNMLGSLMLSGRWRPIPETRPPGTS